MINQIHTSCKDCIFATYNGITQIGCKTGELDKMKKHGIEILEVFDEEKEFYVINKTKCTYMCTKGWKLENEPLQTQIIHIKSLLKIVYELIIIVNVNDNIEDVKVTVDSALNQTLPPTYITIIRLHESKILPSTLYSFAQTITGKVKDWKVQNCIRTGDHIELLDIVIPFSKAPISALFYAGFDIPKDTFEQINYALHEKFLQITLLLPNSTGNGLFIPNAIHKVYQGSYQAPFLQKLKDDKCPYLIPITEVVKNFPA